MVTQWGMSERLGPRTFGRRDSMVFLGRDIAEQRDYSERTAEEIDDEVRRIVEESHECCRALLAKHRDKLDELAEALMELETIEGDALLRLLGPAEGREIPMDEPQPNPPPEDTRDASANEEDEEEPMGRPGLAWGQSNIAPSSDSG